MIAEIPERLDNIYIVNYKHPLTVYFYDEQNKIIHTTEYITYSNGYRTNKFNLNQISRLVRDITYEDITNINEEKQP